MSNCTIFLFLYIISRRKKNEEKLSAEQLEKKKLAAEELKIRKFKAKGRKLAEEMKRVTEYNNSSSNLSICEYSINVRSNGSYDTETCRQMREVNHAIIPSGIQSHLSCFANSIQEYGLQSIEESEGHTDSSELPQLHESHSCSSSVDSDNLLHNDCLLHEYYSPTDVRDRNDRVFDRENMHAILVQTSLQQEEIRTERVISPFVHNSQNTSTLSVQSMEICVSLTAIDLCDYNYVAATVEIASYEFTSITSTDSVGNNCTVFTPAPYCDHNYSKVVCVPNIDIVDCGNVIIEDKPMTGNRIINFWHVLQQLRFTYEAHKTVHNCPFEAWKLVTHKDKLLRTKLTFQCACCFAKGSFWTVPEKNIAKCSVLGTITGGIAFQNMVEVLASVGCNYITEKKYIYIRDTQVVHDLIAVKEIVMHEAAEMEKEESIRRDNTVDDIAIVPVQADGNWMTRDYEHDGDSLAGSASIVGNYTRKILDSDVRIKYCYVCRCAELKGTQPKPHLCFQNYPSYKSASSMEADILKSLFARSMEKHTVMYGVLVIDGDASVQKQILDSKPYPKIEIEVVRCVNHLKKNMVKNLRKIAKQEGKGKLGSIRQLCDKKAFKFRDCLNEAIRARNSENLPDSERIIKLQEDIMTLPYHIYGNHERCKDLSICVGKASENEVDLVPLLQECGMFDKIVRVMERISLHARSLLLDLTTNMSESVHGVMAKTNSGKRMQYSHKGGWVCRSSAAVIQWNTQQVLTDVTRMIKDYPQYETVRKLEETRKKKVARTRRARELKKQQRNAQNRKRRKKGGLKDPDYGENAQQPDMPREEYDKRMRDLFAELERDLQDREKMAKMSKTEAFQTYGGKRICASYLGRICNMADTTSVRPVVKEMLYGETNMKAKADRLIAMAYGREQEPYVKKYLREVLGWNITDGHYVIDPEYVFLDGRPDAFYGKDGLVEIKCPVELKGCDPEVAKFDKTKKHFYSLFTKDRKTVNKKHPWYSQIQGYLHMTRRKFCKLVIKGNTYLILHIEYDVQYIKETLLPKSTRFYRQGLAREIVDSQVEKSREVKEAEYVLQARKKRDAAKAQRESAKAQCNAGKPTSDDESSNPKPSEKTKKRAKRKLGDNSADVGDVTSTKQAKMTLPVDDDVSQSSTSPSMNPPIHVSLNDIDKCGMRDTVFDPVTNKVYSASLVKYVKNKLNIDSTYRKEAIKHVVSNKYMAWLNDDDIDSMLALAKRKLTSACNLISSRFFNIPGFTPPCTSKVDVQVVGGGGIARHWRCLYFNNGDLKVYDSRSEKTKIKSFKDLESDFQLFIVQRYLGIDTRRVTIVSGITQQPDDSACGAFAMSYAVDLLRGVDPATVTYRTRVVPVRERYKQILKEQELRSFCVENWNDPIICDTAKTVSPSKLQDQSPLGNTSTRVDFTKSSDDTGDIASETILQQKTVDEDNSTDTNKVIVDPVTGAHFQPWHFKLLVESFSETLDLRQVAQVVTDNNYSEWLNDYAINMMLVLVKREIDRAKNLINVCYLQIPGFIPPCTDSSFDVQVVGGGMSNHWWCMRFQNGYLDIYDTLIAGKTSYKDLKLDEQRVITGRYPGIDTSKVRFVRGLTQQPDFCSCGVYAVAVAVSLFLGEDPLQIDYSRNAKNMREHFMQILRTGKIVSFRNVPH